MKKITRILLVLLVLIVPFNGGSADVEAASGFDINVFRVEMDVQEDGKILVTERLDVHFYSHMHGIYVNIPSRYNMTWEMNGQTLYKQYHFPVTHVKVLSDHKNEIENFSEGVQIKIGSANYYAKEYETYEYSYEIVTRDLDLDGLQMLFMNIISGNWDANINRVEFTIKMPKAFDESKLLFDSPVGVTNTSVGPFSFVVTGNTISGRYDETLQRGEALTVQLMLNDGYFKFPDINRYSLIGLLISAIVTLIGVILFYIFGKDDPVIETVEFHAPSGVTSAEVGTIIDGEANDGDVVSLILDWARKGLLTISDTSEGMIITKIDELPPGHRHFEAVMFNALFKGREQVNIKNLKGSFYTTIHRTETEIDKYFHRKDEYRLFTKQSQIVQGILTFLSFLPMAIVSGIIIYFSEYNLGSALVGCVFVAIPIIFCTSILCRMESKRYVHKRSTKAFMIAGCLLLFGFAGLMLMVYTFVCEANAVYSAGAIVLNILFIFCTVYMKKRTEYSNQLLGQVLGLRNFIIVAEKDRLQELVDENPYYFYDILPYAYALGLTNVWNEHFKDLTIAPCTWYISPYNTSPYYSMHSLESQMNTIESNLTTVPVSSSGGSSFSSSGGGSSGGFSGGGFGGSGGGGW